MADSGFIAFASALEDLCSEVGYYPGVYAVVGLIAAGFFGGYVKSEWVNGLVPIMALPALAQDEAVIRAGCGRLGYWSVGSLFLIALVGFAIGFAIVSAYDRSWESQRRIESLEREVERLRDEK